MSPRERLHLLVDELADDQAERALQFLEELTEPDAQQVSTRPLPAFVGMGHSGRGDTARRAKDILREELGRAGQPPL